MRKALKLLLLLGLGVLLTKNRTPDGTDGNGDDGDSTPGDQQNSEERDERLNFEGQNASSQMPEVHAKAEKAAEKGRAEKSGESSSSESGSDDPETTTPPRDADLDRLQERLDNNKEHLQYKDLDAARRELNGEVVATKSDGTPWDHVHEVRDAQNGLLAIIDRAKRKLGDSRVSDEDKAEYEALISEASSLLDYSEGFVPRN
jgi:hypothetical protein